MVVVRVAAGAPKIGVHVVTWGWISIDSIWIQNREPLCLRALWQQPPNCTHRRRYFVPFSFAYYRPPPMPILNWQVQPVFFFSSAVPSKTSAFGRSSTLCQIFCHCNKKIRLFERNLQLLLIFLRMTNILSKF